MIDELIDIAVTRAVLNGAGVDGAIDEITIRKEALTAIYEIGLECIGAAEPVPARKIGLVGGYEASVRNRLRAEQRSAWAKACGVSGGYIPGAGWVTVGEGKGEE